MLHGYSYEAHLQQHRCYGGPVPSHHGLTGPLTGLGAVPRPQGQHFNLAGPFLPPQAANHSANAQGDTPPCHLLEVAIDCLRRWG